MNSSAKARRPRKRSSGPPESTTLNGHPVRPQSNPEPTSEASATPSPASAIDAAIEANDIQSLERRLEALQRLKVFREARDDFLLYCQLMMPSPDDPDDLTQSLYEVAKHHKVLAAALEEVERGNWPRLIVTMPPRHGKTQQISKFFPAWFAGRDPYRSIIIATYNDDYAGDIGRDVRDVLRHPRHLDVFPQSKLKIGAQASDRIKTAAGGQLSFVGRGSSSTGRGGHLLIADDLIKDAEEADSPTMREKIWNWFVKVFLTRQMKVGACVVLVMTRWNEDDIVGRLTDPHNPAYNRDEAAKWKVLNLPAIAELNDPMGRKPGEALWPERFPLTMLEAQKRLDPSGFMALYQQRPSPEEGSFFRAAWMKTYLATNRPRAEEMRIYAASDHAIGTDKKKHDASVMVIAGVCPNKYLWLLDCYWDRRPPDQTVEAMLDMVALWKPSYWFAENEAILKSIGPWIHKRKIERGIPVVIDSIPVHKNKEAIAQSIAGLMQAGRVVFPKAAPWFPEAKHELLHFPHGTNDDFVTAISIMGLKVLQLIAGTPQRDLPSPTTGTFGWWKKEMAYQDRIRNGPQRSEVW
jgi:predicted phage terminase large subunit-like protein